MTDPGGAMELAIQDADLRMKVDRTTTLAALLDIVVGLDTRLGNIAVSVCDMRQVVDPKGRDAWYVVNAQHRAKRPGVDRSLQPEDSPILLDNVRAVGKQCWASFRLGDTPLVVLANPSPHVTGTVTIASLHADPQTWRADDARATPKRVRSVASLMTALAEHLPGRYVSFNNDGSGNSLSQFHISVNRHPEGVDELPIERAISLHRGHRSGGTWVLGLHDEYPLPTIVVAGNGSEVSHALAAAIVGWDTQPDRTGNVLVRATAGGEIVATFWPRTRTWRRAPGFRSGEIAFMELSGCFVISNRADFAAVECGRYDYNHFWLVLQGVADRRAYDFAERVSASRA
jgi:hypothetical protein